MPKWESKCQPFELLKVREIFHNSFFCVFNDKFSVEIKNDPNETDLVCFETRITQTHEILLITSSLPVFVTTSSVNFYFTLKIYQTPFSQFDFSLARFFCALVFVGMTEASFSFVLFYFTLHNGLISFWYSFIWVLMHCTVCVILNPFLFSSMSMFQVKKILRIFVSEIRFALSAKLV